MMLKTSVTDWTTLARQVYDTGFDGSAFKSLLAAMSVYLHRVAYNADKRDPEGFACDLQYVVFRALRSWRREPKSWMQNFDHYVKRAVHQAVIGHKIRGSSPTAKILADAEELPETLPAELKHWHYTVTDARLLKLFKIADPLDRLVITRLERGDTPSEVARLLMVDRSAITRRIQQMRARVTNCATKVPRGASIDIRYE